MRPVRPVFVVDFKRRPKILPQVILESRIPQYRIAEIANERTRFWNGCTKRSSSRQTIIGLDWHLNANRRLNIEIAPAFAEGQGGLRNPDIVWDAGPVAAWTG